MPNLIPYSHQYIDQEDIELTRPKSVREGSDYTYHPYAIKFALWPSHVPIRRLCDRLGELWIGRR